MDASSYPRFYHRRNAWRAWYSRRRRDVWIHRRTEGVHNVHLDLGYHLVSDSFREAVGYFLLSAEDHRVWHIFSSLSKRAKDTIVLEYACAGMRIGVPQDLLSKDYDSFLIAFDQRLDILDAGYSLTRVIVENVEGSVLSAKKNIITAILVRIALMIGYDLLPTRVREKYQLKILSTWWQRAIQKILIAVLWVIYPMLMWVPLRGMICLLLVLEPQLRSIFMVRYLAYLVHSVLLMAYSRLCKQFIRWIYYPTNPCTPRETHPPRNPKK